MSVVLITGARRGLGRELAKLHAQKGDDVIASSREFDPQDRLVSIKGIKTIELDVSSTDSVRSAIDALSDEYETIDLVYLNAAIFQSVLTLDIRNWNADSQLDMFNVNSLGPIRVIQSLITNNLLQNSTLMFISSSASIITNTESYASTHAFRSINLGYNMSKAALNSAAMTIKGVCNKKTNVIVVDPGWMKTQMGGRDATLDPEVAAQKLYRLATSGQNFCSLVDANGNSLPW